MRDEVRQSFAEATQTPCQIDTAVIPVAGWGTRMMPATMALPKHFQFVGDFPLVYYAVKEAQEAGVKNFVFIIGDSPFNRELMERQFLPQDDLNEYLQAKGKLDILEMIEALKLRPDQVSFVVQKEQTGLWDAVKSAKDKIVGHTFAVITPDDLILRAEAGLPELAKHHQPGGITISVEEVQQEDVSKFGIVACGPASADGAYAVTGVIEKPALENAPAVDGKYTAANGRYIFPTKIFDLYTPETGPTVTHEVSTADAINALAGELPVRAVLLPSGARRDCGDPFGLALAVTEAYLNNPRFGDAYRQALTKMLAIPQEAPRKRVHVVTAADANPGRRVLTAGSAP